MGPGAAEEGVPRPRVQERAVPVVREAAAAGVGLAPLWEALVPEERGEQEAAAVGVGLAPLQGVPVPEEQVVQEAEAVGVGSAPLQGALAPEEQVGQVVVAGQRSSLLPALPLPRAPHSWRGTDLSHRWDLLLTTSPRRLGQ